MHVTTSDRENAPMLLFGVHCPDCGGTCRMLTDAHSAYEAKAVLQCKRCHHEFLVVVQLQRITGPAFTGGRLTTSGAAA